MSLLNLSAFADTKQYRFTNAEAAHAADLHIEFNHGVSHDPATQQNPANTFPEVDGGSGESTIGLGGEFGAGVAVGASVTLTFTFDGTTPQVKKWWWTKNGDASDDSNGNRLGAIKYPSKGQFDLMSVPSTGDGLIEFSQAGDVSIFAMPAGVSGEEMATLLADYIDNVISWGEVENIDGTTLTLFSTSLSEQLHDFSVNIIPDSSQEVSFKYQPEVIPTLSEWGVIILLLLTLAVGMVFLYQRQPALAMAGGAEISNAKPRLFDKTLFAKVFAIVLTVGIVILAGAYLYFGQITNADPFGTFVSAGIVAYMVHLWMLKSKEQSR